MAATITHTVTAGNGKYLINGVEQKALTFSPGNTYKFDISDVSMSTHPFKLSTNEEGSEYTTEVTRVTDNHLTIVVDSSTPSTLYYYCAAHSGMGAQITVNHAQCKEPYGTAGGRPAYNSALPPCTGAAVDANGVVQASASNGCLCSRCGDIRVIVALPGESCDSDGYWDAKTGDTDYFDGRERDRTNFGFEENCDVQCEEAYAASTRADARGVRRFLRAISLKATQNYNGEDVNYVCLPSSYTARNENEANKDFECSGCKKCKDDADKADFGYKHATYEFNGKTYGGCEPWCKARYEDTNLGPAKVCKYTKCSGCAMCEEYANADSYTDSQGVSVNYTSTDLDTAQQDSDKTRSLFKFKVPTEDIHLNGVLFGGCFPWCRTKFFDANKGPGTVCKWKKCSGCKACTLYAEDHATDESNDGFRFKLNTEEVDTNDNDRKSPTHKKYGGCLNHCKNSAISKGLEKICKWRGCSGCEVCKPGVVAEVRIPADVKSAEISRNGVFKSIGDILYEKIASNKNLVPQGRRSQYTTGGSVDATVMESMTRLFAQHRGTRKGDCPNTPGDCPCAGMMCMGKCQKDSCKGCEGCQ